MKKKVMVTGAAGLIGCHLIEKLLHLGYKVYGLDIVDLTGAGDLFAAGYLHGYINGLSAKDSLQKGTEMSSKIIQKIGARLD